MIDVDRRQPPPLLVVGVGNRDRGDDGIGPALADELVARFRGRRGRDHEAAPPVEVVVVEGDLVDLPLRWSSDQDVLVVDAARSAAAPGSLRFLEPAELGASTAPICSTHGLGIAEAVTVAGHLDRLPRRLAVAAVVGERFEFGGLSAPVRAALPGVSAALAAEVEAGLPHARPRDQLAPASSSGTRASG